MLIAFFLSSDTGISRIALFSRRKPSLLVSSSCASDLKQNEVSDFKKQLFILGTGPSLKTDEIHTAGQCVQLKC